MKPVPGWQVYAPPPPSKEAIAAQVAPAGSHLMTSLEILASEVTPRTIGPALMQARGIVKLLERLQEAAARSATDGEV